MPSPSQKAMSVAASPEFHARVRLALVKVALVEIESDDVARAAFSRKVLRGELNMPVVSMAVVVNPSIGAAIANAAEDDATAGVDDASIAFVVAEYDDPAAGVFHKLALANAGG